MDIEELLLLVCSWRLFGLVELTLLLILMHAVVIADRFELLRQDWHTRAVVPYVT